LDHLVIFNGLEMFRSELAERLATSGVELRLVGKRHLVKGVPAEEGRRAAACADMSCL
jgi:hypothetical protein